ncbi:Cna B-type domain-containing protein [Lacticaseibacillus sharpeae]|uniref:Cna B-type domain-containing protein n=1 Tax=Lacticaseibacillus sharpeae TaxID=1626 RepID=UPI0021E758B3|nr:Cna B-type domain-containing protein [Lacticaseibacillus sharpeae]
MTVKLLANGTEVKSKKVTAADKWQYSFDNLPVYKDGQKIAYTIGEDTVDGYTSKTTNFDLTNTHTPDVTTISGTKTWDDKDDQDGKRPAEITVNLLADGKQVASKQVSKADDWKYTFTDQPKYANGKEIVYTVSEGDVDGYTSKTTGFDLTNTHTPETTNVEGKKTWDDNDNQDGKRPASIEVHLLKNDKEIDKKTVTAKDNWQYSFTDLPKYENGKEINYTISETKVAGYETTVNGYDLTNSYTPAKTEFSGSKTWDDGNNQDGNRPDSITVYLLANGDKVQSQQVTAANNWQYSFTNLDEFKNGQKIDYSVDEDAPAGYIKTIKDHDITNAYKPAETQVEGNKFWNDGNDQDGKRPTSITVNLIADGVKIKSQTVTKANNWQYNFTGLPKNANGHPITYTIEEVPVPGYTTSIQGYNLTNTYTPETTQVSGTKTWKDANNQDGKRPSSITVKLLANGTEVKSKKVTAADKWQYSFDNLPVYNDGQQIAYTIDEDDVAGYDKQVSGDDLINTHTPATTQVTGTKTWDDANNQDGIRPTSIDVELLKNGQEFKHQTVTQADNWKYSFTDLPQYEDGKEINYTIAEAKVDGYKTNINGTDLTNSHTPATTEISGHKTWDDADDQDGKRPSSITVNLFADGKQVQSKKVTASDNWQYSFTNLDEYKDGVKINYTIDEDSPAGYIKTIKGTDLTNSYRPEETQVEGYKVWNDANDQDGKRPSSITVNLLANGKQVQSKTVTAKDDWRYNFTGLPKNDHGKKIVYTIDEASVAGYSKKISGYDLTNTHQPATTKVTGTKTWNDANNQDGKRPGSITVYLLANGQKVQSKQVSASDNWQYSFTNLPQYANGKQINYSIDESDVAGYAKSVNGTNLTNTHTPDLVAVTGTKTWNDAANQDGMRPDSITVTLLANGKAVQTRTVSAATNWQYNFTSLPKYADGKAISYTVDENAVAGYTKSVSGYDLTNTHTPETTTIAGTKTWNDNNDQDGKRPESITVRLLANGVEAASKTVTAADNWQYNFTDLPKYDDGKAIVYTVAEDAVAGYTTTTDGDNLTNTHTPEVTAVAGTKTWLDDDDTYGMRPESITVHLLANGKTVATKEVTADDNWQYSFTNLPVFANGKQIVYTISEDEVDGYTSSVDGYDLTNTILPFPPLPNTFGNVPPTGPHTPNQPNKPNKPNQPKTPHTPGQPGNGGHLPDTFGGLPQTGDANNQWVLTLLGAGMLVTLLAVALRKREEFKA